MINWMMLLLTLNCMAFFNIKRGEHHEGKKPPIPLTEVKTEALEHQAYFMCKSGKIVRTIRIDQVEGEHKCKARYIKGGVERTVGWAKTVTGCMPIVQNILSNLKDANWKCRDISTATVVRSDQVVH